MTSPQSKCEQDPTQGIAHHRQRLTMLVIVILYHRYRKSQSSFLFESWR